ncbi:hypothetical protein, partial [Aeromonas hydrophila]|uniref:hypothetical protein n=1 Tax=Aeromonas hydrophila TaxID=644 RepID=UPI0021165A5D
MAMAIPGFVYPTTISGRFGLLQLGHQLPAHLAGFSGQCVKAMGARLFIKLFELFAHSPFFSSHQCNGCAAEYLGKPNIHL